MSATPRTDALAAKLYDLNVTGSAAALALLDGCRKIERELPASFAEGYRAARRDASTIVNGYTDGDGPFDSTIAEMVDKIDRLAPPKTGPEMGVTSFPEPVDSFGGPIGAAVAAQQAGHSVGNADTTRLIAQLQEIERRPGDLWEQEVARRAREHIESSQRTTR
jgi:hypothetical protein